MYHLNDEIYARLATEIYFDLSSIHYFTGKVFVVDAEAEHTLTATLIIYRRNAKVLSEEYNKVIDVVPVWYEFKTEVNGEVVEDDFDFADLRAVMIDE